MKHRIRKILLRFILLPILSLVLLVGIAAAILYSQQQRLVALAVKELNKKLPGRLAIAGSDISIFQNLPYISIRLQQVQFYDGKLPTAKAICEVEHLYVGFSLPDLLKQQYHVKAIALKNGHIDLVQDKDGILNLLEAVRTVGDSTTKKDTASTALDLDVKKVVLKNIRLSFLDERSGQQVSSQIDRIQSSLRADSAQILADLQGKMLVDYRRPGDTSLFRHNHLETSIQFSYNKSTQLLKLPVGRLQLEGALFNITGTADLLHDNTVDFRITGDKPDLGQLLSFAPPAVLKELKHFRYDGRLEFDATIKGPLKEGQQPLITLSFSCANAWLHNKQANRKLDSLAFKGYYTNGPSHSLKTSELRILNMTAKPGEGLFKGNFVMRDFTDPKIAMQVNSELELAFVGDFLGIKDLQRVTGHISLKMDFKDMVDLSLPEQSMGKLTQGIQSELTVRNLTFRVPSYPYLVDHLDLHANMKDGFVKLDTLSFKIGNSDFHMDGSLSDLPALFHHQEKPVILTLNAGSKRMVLKELLAFDTVKSRKTEEAEEIYGFTIGLSLETSVKELLHPSPLPKGKLTIKNLNTAFKYYPNAYHNFGAELAIGDTTLLLRNLAGNIDSSDIHFSGRVNNYGLWFQKVKKGTTQIAFDLKSQRLAMNDLLGRYGNKYMPKDYYQEIGSNIWLRSKMDLEYDSVFHYANIRIANISGALKLHPYRMDSISGNIKFSTDNYIKIDTLKGRIGNSDFNLSMRLYAGKDTLRRKKENFLRFSSRNLDIDQLTNYVLAAEAPSPSLQDDTTASSAGKPAVPAVAGTATHEDGFNLFRIPFMDFNATVNVGWIKYHNLGLKNFFTNLRMQANQQLILDTLGIEVAGGKIGARAQLNGSDPNKIYLKSRICAEDVNIEKLLLKLDYLGQDYVINKNIVGSLSGQIESYVQVHPDLTPIIEQTEAKLDLEILNGALVNFAPMKAMSSYFKDKNLNIVRFDTLRNTLTFKNGALFIPDMNINSSLGYLEISGKQSLDMKMEYYIRIPLKMVTQVGFRMLFGKKKEEVDPDQVDAIEYRDKDKKVRFMNLKITGTPDAYKVGLGKAART